MTPGVAVRSRSGVGRVTGRVEDLVPQTTTPTPCTFLSRRYSLPRTYPSSFRVQSYPTTPVDLTGGLEGWGRRVPDGNRVSKRSGSGSTSHTPSSIYRSVLDQPLPTSLGRLTGRARPVRNSGKFESIDVLNIDWGPAPSSTEPCRGVLRHTDEVSTLPAPSTPSHESTSSDPFSQT